MRSRLIQVALILFLLACSAFGQTTTITGTINDLTNNPVTSGKVVFTLKPSVDTTISGNARFTPGQPITCYIQSNGTLLNAGQTGTCTVVTNTSLTPAGTSYRVDVCPYNACSSSFNFYAINSSYDISTIVPTPTTGPAQNFTDVFSNQTVAGNKTFTGQTTLSGGITLSGMSTLTGPTFLSGACLVGGELMVSPGCFTGSDINTQINNAYGSAYCLFATGCRIRVPPNPAGGCWTSAVPIVLATAGQPATLEGDPGGATCIHFTQTSGVALTIDPGTSNYTPQGAAMGAGARDITFTGPCTQSGNVPNCGGITTVGLLTGPTNGSEGMNFQNVKFGILGAGFLYGINIGAASFGNVFMNSSAWGNQVGYLENHLSEKNFWLGGFLSQNVTGADITTAGSDPTFVGVHFNDNTSCGAAMTANSNLTLEDDRWENGGGGTDCWGNFSAGSVYIHNGQTNDDLTSGSSAQSWTFGGNSLVVNGLREYITAGHTLTNMWNLTNNSSNVELHVDDISTVYTSGEYNSSFSGRIDYKSISPSGNPSPYVISGYELFLTQLAMVSGATIPAPGSSAFTLLPNNTILALWENAGGSGNCGLGVDSSNRLFFSGSGCTVLFPSTRLNDQGTCTMSSGSCGAISLSRTYTTAPQCFGNWNGTGTLTGYLSFPSTTSTVTPQDSVSGDTAHVNWFCLGN